MVHIKSTTTTTYRRHVRHKATTGGNPEAVPQQILWLKYETRQYERD